MILCFSGTGNSRYIANRIAKALQDEVVDLNTKMKEKDTSLLRTGENMIVVAPTYVMSKQNGIKCGNCGKKSKWNLRKK